MSHGKNIKVEKSYGNGSDIKKSTEKSFIKKSDGNSLMAKYNALKCSKTLNLTVKLQRLSSSLSVFP